MTPAETITAAVKKLRSGMLVARVDLDMPLAKLLNEAVALHEPNVCDKHEGCAPPGCQWCGDEDFPCADIRNALAVARAVLGTPDQP